MCIRDSCRCRCGPAPEGFQFADTWCELRTCQAGTVGSWWSVPWLRAIGGLVGAPSTFRQTSARGQLTVAELVDLWGQWSAPPRALIDLDGSLITFSAHDFRRVFATETVCPEEVTRPYRRRMDRVPRPLPASQGRPRHLRPSIWDSRPARARLHPPPDAPSRPDPGATPATDRDQHPERLRRHAEHAETAR